MVVDADKYQERKKSSYLANGECSGVNACGWMCWCADALACGRIGEKTWITVNQNQNQKKKEKKTY